MTSKGLKPVFGSGPIGEGKDFPKVSMIEKLYTLLKEGGCTTIDTGRLYSNSEEWIGKTSGGDHFTIDSKTPGGFISGGSDSVGILQHAKKTVERLGVKSVSVERKCLKADLMEYRSMYTISTALTPPSISKTCSNASTPPTKPATSHDSV
jgi:hypothetical protein